MLAGFKRYGKGRAGLKDKITPSKVVSSDVIFYSGMVAMRVRVAVGVNERRKFSLMFQLQLGNEYILFFFLVTVDCFFFRLSLRKKWKETMRKKIMVTRGDD